jgi:hypothetical protein
VKSSWKAARSSLSRTLRRLAKLGTASSAWRRLMLPHQHLALRQWFRRQLPPLNSHPRQ